MTERAQPKHKPFPEVGMGATMAVGSDRYAYTIVKVSESGKTIDIQSEIAINEGDYFGTQKWVHTHNLEGAIKTARLSKSGYYMCGGSFVFIGYRDSYRDPSF